MATFSRQSWHYKFLSAFKNPWALQDISSNFCRYFRSLTIHLFFAAIGAVVLFAAAQGVVFILGSWLLSLLLGTPFLFPGPSVVTGFYGAYFAVSTVLGGLSLAAGIALAIAGIIHVTVEYLKDKARERRWEREKQEIPKKPDSLVSTKMKALHDKVCPTVDWVD